MNAAMTQRKRAKRTSLTALALVAILAGVAVAYFLKSEKFTNNKAIGGQLTVEATLPIDFTDTPLYPTSPPPSPYDPTKDVGPNKTPDGNRYVDETLNGVPEHDFDYHEKDFDINNNNPVDADYSIYATCEECVADPTDTPDQAKIRDDKRDQFNSLYVSIYNDSKNYYTGRLADLSPTAKKSLGKIQADDFNSYTVRIWLQDDTTREQPQSVESIWEFIIDAKTPTA
jgi:hypothetical protein